MFNPVYPIHRRPLVVRTGVDYRFTALVVDQVDAVDGRYEVLFLGTGETQTTVTSRFNFGGKIKGFSVFVQIAELCKK